MNQPYSLTIRQLRDLLEKRQTIPGNLYENAERKVLCYPDDGDGGLIPTTTPLCISNLSTLMVSPMGCGIHLTETGRGPLDVGRAWLLRLQERDIVLGRQRPLVLEAVETILAQTSSPLEGLLISATCLDGLLATDYDALCREIQRRFSIRCAFDYMGPLLKGSPRQAETKMISACYGLLRPCSSTDPGLVNLLGPLRSSQAAELNTLLAPLGVRQVCCLADFSSLSAADAMTGARLNLVLGGGALWSAREMQRKWGIPYVSLSDAYDPAAIAAHYREIGLALCGTVDDRFLRHQVAQRAACLASQLEGQSCAVGGKNDVPCFSAAYTLLELGFSVTTLFAHHVTGADLPLVRALADRVPHMRVYFDSHPSLYRYQATPEEFTLSFGVPDPFIPLDGSIRRAPILRSGATYGVVLRYLDELEQVLRAPAVPRTLPVPHPFRRVWNEAGCERRI